MSRKLYVYTWEATVNCDWTCGDAIAIAPTPEKAWEMVKDQFDYRERDTYKAPDSTEELKGFVYFGPGGA